VRKPAFLVFLALFFLPDCSFGGAGRSAVQTLSQPISARPAGLAEAYSAEASGADSLGYNPAGLALASAPELLAQYHGGFMGDTFLNAGYAQQAGNFGIGASVLSYNSGGVELKNKYGEKISATGERDIVYSAGLGVRLPWAGLSAGAALKFVDAQVVEQFSGKALAGDAGIRFDVPETSLSLGASAQNLGNGIKIADEHSSLPSVLRAGMAYRFNIEAEETRMAGMEGVLEPAIRPEPAPHRLLLLCDGIYRMGDRIASLALGAEFSYHGFFAVRTGARVPVYGTGTRNTVASVGIGARIRRATLDYAVEMTSAAALHRVSVSFVF